MDRPVLVLAVAAVVVTVLGAIWLGQAALGGRLATLSVGSPCVRELE